MDIILALIALLVFLLFIILTLWLIQATLFSVVEEMYMHAFKKPIYIHFYPRKKKLTGAQESILLLHFPFYKQLPAKHQTYFRHRVAKFMEKHEYIGREDFVVTDEAKIMIAATAVMLTFGMRKYLFEVIDKIIIYPSIYQSTTTHEWHKGEFNPRVKAVVFSWEDFRSGIEVGNDNLNLGLHEFSHVVHHHGSKNEDSSAILFSRMYKRIDDEMKIGVNRQRLIDSNYFRVYAYTNAFEFLAVIIEHYFETPRQFKAEFPELYKNVSLMLNYRNA